MSKQLSLQEQLLKSGLVSSSKAKSIKTEKHKQVQQQRHNKIVVVDEAKQLVQQVQVEKVERDKVLNQQHQAHALQKELQAQIKQMIEQNNVPIDTKNAEIAYHFTDAPKVKTLYVTEALRDQLAKGKLAIVKAEVGYALVNSEIAQKIKDRDDKRILAWNEPKTEIVTDDPYAAFEIPDDLIW